MRRSDGSGARLQELVADAVARVEARYASGPEELTGVSDLDGQIGSLGAATALVIVSVLPTDATTLALQIAVRAAVQHHPLSVASTRLRPAAIADRMLALATRIDGRHLAHGRLNEDAWWQLGRAVRRLEGLDVQVSDDVSVERLHGIGGSQDETTPTPFVVVDGIEPLLHAGRAAAIGDLRRLVESSSCGWVFTSGCAAADEAVGGIDPTWDAAVGRGLGDVTLQLRRQGRETLACIEHSYGWGDEVVLHQHPGGGYHGRAAPGMRDCGVSTERLEAWERVDS